MGFGKIKHIDVIKDVDEENSEYMNLFRLGIRVKDEKKREQIFKDAMFHKYGLEGEKRVMYELKNSFIPMHIFHNVRLEEAGYTAQIDIIAITNVAMYFIETKQLFGDIEITEKDEFIRHFKNSNGKFYKKEAMYNPNVQVCRQREIFNEIAKRHNAHKPLIIKVPYIVLSNPKSILNKKKAGEVLQLRVLKIDQLVKDIKKFESTLPPVITKSMIEYSDFIAKNCKPAEYDYLKRYGVKEDELLPERNLSTDEMMDIVRMYRQKEDMTPVLEEHLLGDDSDISVSSDEELINKLKKYRIEQAKKFDIALGFVFSNKELEEMIDKKPVTAQEVSNIPGFGPKKTERHASDIAQIIKNHK